MMKAGIISKSACRKMKNRIENAAGINSRVFCVSGSLLYIYHFLKMGV